MARRPNYGGEKRQKEINRLKKREEKAEKKRIRKEEAARGDGSPDPADERSDAEETSNQG